MDNRRTDSRQGMIQTDSRMIQTDSRRAGSGTYQAETILDSIYSSYGKGTGGPAAYYRNEQQSTMFRESNGFGFEFAGNSSNNMGSLPNSHSNSLPSSFRSTKDKRRGQ